VGQLAQTLIGRGKAEGRVEGLAEGLEQLLEHFGPLPDAIRDRISGASPDQLKAWLRAARTAPSLDSVFGPRLRH